EVIEAAVPGDAVEPGPRVDRPLVGEDRVVGGREDVLQDVLGVFLRAEHVAAEGEEPGPVAREENLEGGVVAVPEKADQALVGLQAKQRRPPAEHGHYRTCLIYCL